MGSVSKFQKKIIEDRVVNEKKMQAWFLDNTHMALPVIFRAQFRRAVLRSSYYTNKFNSSGFGYAIFFALMYHFTVLKGLIHLFGIEMRFSTDENNRVINVGIFRRGKYFDSYVKPEKTE